MAGSSSQALLTAAVMAAVAAALPAQLPAGLQFAELAKRHLPADSDPTRAIACGDIDRDGDLDMVVGNSGQNRLYLNDGTGIFTDATASRMPVDSDVTNAVALGDLDGDGDLDMVVGNHHQQNRLYLNDGTGAFSDATTTRMPIANDFTRSMALGDVDGDGDLDVAVGNAGQDRLYLNNGAGGFTDATASRMPVNRVGTRSVALGDVDGDGDLDMVLGNYFSGGPSRLYLNDGAGTFSDATQGRIPVNWGDTTSVALGDVDGDGDTDILLGSARWGGPNQNSLYLNDGTGMFTDATASRMPVDSDWTNSVALGDLDGDGDLDMVVGNYGQQDRLYLNDGTGAFSDATAVRMPIAEDFTRSMALGDVDGDGDLDVVTGNFYDQNRLCRNDGTGTFTDATASRLPVDSDHTPSMALCDIDGDGDLDLLLGSGGQNRLYLNDSAGTFIDATATRMPPNYDITLTVAVGDVDRDGDLDLVTGNYGQNTLYLNNGTGVLTDATASRMPVDSDGTRSVALGDLDGDGDLDLVLGNGAQNRLYVNNGAGTFTDATASRMPIDSDATYSLALGDVDGDGDLDIVLGNHALSYLGRGTRLYLNDGTGVFTDVTATHMPVSVDAIAAVALGDVDGDGDLDVVLGCTNGYIGSSQTRLFLNDGRGSFTDATTSRVPSDGDATSSVALGDIDGDGDLDLVLGNGGAQQDRLYLNGGAGTFTDATASRMPVDGDDTSAVALGDVDRDGDLDLVIGNSGQDRLYTNLQRQLDAPHLLRPGQVYALDVYSRYGPPSLFEWALPFLSITRVSVPVPPYGVLGIDLSFPLPPALIPQPAGVSTVTWNVPNVPSLAGIELFAQAVVATSAGELRLTNVTADVLQR